jgi:Lrp/AsnC family transcriptional regulator of ectoine degradation
MTAIKLDAIDLKILETLQREGRITKAALAGRVGLSPTPCWERLKRLEKAGVIQGYHAKVNPKPIASSIQVLTEITLKQHTQAAFERFEKAVGAVAEIISCWSTGGGIDYLLLILVPDIDAYQRLLDRLLNEEIGIDRYFTYVVTKPVKEGAPLPLRNLLQREGS